MTLARVRYEVVLILSWLSLLAERFWASFWPAISVLLAFFGLASLKFFTVFGNEVHIGLLFAFTALFYIALMRFGTKFHVPSPREVRRAIEKESELWHRPLEALEDKPVAGSPKESVILWEKYQERLKKLWSRTKIHRPRPDVGSRDPYSLRFAAMLTLLLGLVIAQQEAPFRIRAALAPSFKQYLVVKAATLDVWITPPDYTRQNPVFLATTQLGAAPTPGPIAVPENSVLKVRIAGYDDAPTFKYGEKEYPLSSTTPKNFTLEMPLTESGHMRISRWFFSKLGDWPVTVVKDRAPGIVLLKSETTKRDQIKLTYTAKDDYRVKDVSGTISAGPELAKALGAKANRTIDFDLPAPESGAEEQVHTADLTSHPWAGSEVMLKLVAHDDAGLTGESEPYKLTLPERNFSNPVAKAIIFQRKQLIWYNNMLTRPVVAQKLFEIGARPDNYKYDHLVYLGLNMAYKRLLFDGSNEDSVDSIVDFLWDLAIRVEDGGLALAKRELSDALQKLAEKLRDKNATKEEIEALMDKVREKSREYAKNLAQETQQRMQGKDNEQISQELLDKIMRQLDTEKLMKEMEDLTQGSEREQMEKMAERMKRNIDRLDPKKMDELQQKHNKTLKGLDDLQKLIERQQQLMDQTNRMLPPKDRMEPEKTHEEQQKEEEQKKKEEQDSKNDQQQQQNQQGQQQGQQQQQQQGQSGQEQGQQQGQQGQQQQQGSQGQQQGQEQGAQGQQQGTQGQQQGQSGQQGQQQSGGQSGQQGQQPMPQPGQNGQQGQQSGQNGEQQGSGGMLDKLQEAVKRAAQEAGKTNQQQQGQQGQGQQGQAMPQPGQNGQQGGPPQPKPEGSEGFTSAEEKEKQRQMQQGAGKEQGQPVPQPGQNGEQQQQMGGGKEGEQQQAAGGEGDKAKPPIRSAGEGASEQGGIREGLGDVMRRLGESMPNVPQNFGKADQEMKASRKEFREEDAKGSLPHQKEALDQMNEGLDKATKQLADQITETMVNFGMPQQPGEGGYGEGFDPLGRGQQGEGGGPGGNEEGRGRPSTGYVKIPDEKERRRVQEIIDELRTRSNDYTRPKSERDYINRLLNQFE